MYALVQEAKSRKLKKPKKLDFLLQTSIIAKSTYNIGKCWKEKVIKQRHKKIKKVFSRNSQLYLHPTKATKSKKRMKILEKKYFKTLN